MNTLKINTKVLAGSNIDETLVDAKDLAQFTNESVEITFNNVLLKIDKNSCLYELKKHCMRNVEIDVKIHYETKK